VAAFGARPAGLGFRKALERHLAAIRDRDLAALAATVADDELVLIGADGKLARTPREFLDAHRAWFDMPGWTLDVAPEVIYETAEMALAVLRLLYRDGESEQPSLLTLVFRKKADRWLMVLDQNTPIK
jgi:ketosteroid isomerase-like protein